MIFFIFNHVFFSLSRFGSKTGVQNVNVKTAEVILAHVKEVSYEPDHNTLSAYIYLFVYHMSLICLFYKAMYTIFSSSLSLNSCFNKQLYNINVFLCENAAYDIQSFQTYAIFHDFKRSLSLGDKLNRFICQGSNTAEFPLLFLRILGMFTAAIVLQPKYIFIYKHLDVRIITAFVTSMWKIIT